MSGWGRSSQFGTGQITVEIPNKFFGTKIFWTKNLFGPNFFLDPTLFGLKNYFEPNELEFCFMLSWIKTSLDLKSVFLFLTEKFQINV